MPNHPGGCRFQGFLLKRAQRRARFDQAKGQPREEFGHGADSAQEIHHQRATAGAKLDQIEGLRPAHHIETLHAPDADDLAEHLTDLGRGGEIAGAAKGIAADGASTGEQKALLIGLVLAHAGLIGEMTGLAPVLLLDEVVAHLDPERRRALYDRLEQIGAQVWMTGADPAAFADVSAHAEVFEISPGHAARLSR